MCFTGAVGGSSLRLFSCSLGPLASWVRWPYYFLKYNHCPGLVYLNTQDHIWELLFIESPSLMKHITIMLLVSEPSRQFSKEAIRPFLYGKTSYRSDWEGPYFTYEASGRALCGADGNKGERSGSDTFERELQHLSDKLCNLGLVI